MNNTITQTISDSQLAQFNELAHKVNGFGLNLLVFDRERRCILQRDAGQFQSDSSQIQELIGQVPEEDIHNASAIWASDTILICPVKINQSIIAVIAIDTGLNAAEKSSQEKIYLACIVEDFNKNIARSEQFPQQIEKFSNELSRAYEEIVLLYNLSTNMQMTQSSASYLQMACDQLTQLIQVEGIAVFIEREVDDHKQLILSAGSGVMVVDTVQADILQMYLVEQLRSGKDALIDSTQDGPLKYQWPETVRNIIAVPLGSADNLLGCLVATNALDKPDFDTTDIKLFNSVANQCTVFIENNRLFDELKELFVGCLKALTNSIDAKDQYTRGHSERVAFIARWIAEHLGRIRPVSDKLVHHAYLAGLLHDIGKIGIGESVLRKNGRLSDTEYAAIQSHPRIGASILSGIHQMEDIVPGVLGHHERVDGRGYPHGLKGDEIPLIAKIVSLADAFDAMTSKRVYRNAMNIQKALDIIADAIGTQFDEEVARVFLDSDVQKLWKIIQDGFIENWNFSNIDEYGVQAVGELI
ncbi:MAG: HD domain-containing phosphohydrolase [Planctomycetota bacterium]|jgi:HD-GYP domain-containing protein (c-di-GMP phosphodiesterase class II)